MGPFQQEWRVSDSAAAGGAKQQAGGGKPAPPAARPVARPYPFITRVLFCAGMFLVLALLSMWLWRSMLRHDRIHLMADLNFASDWLAKPIEDAIDEQLLPLRQLGRAAGGKPFASEQDFSTATEAVAGRLSNYAFVAWVDDRGTCRYVVPRDAAGGLIGGELHEHPDWAGAVGRARALWAECAGETELPKDGDSRMNFVVPVTTLVEGEAVYAGAVIGTLRLRPVINAVMDRHAGTRLALELRDSDVPLVRGGARGPVDALPGVHEPVRVLDRALELRVQPTEEFMETTMRGRTWFLFGGLGMSALIAGGVFQALRHRWVEADQDRRHVEALESLNEITAAISARLGSSQQLLDQLAASAST